jgi:hypothetical protein
MAEEQISVIAGGSAAPESPASNVVTLPTGTVTLHPKVTIPLGIAALSVIKQGGGQAAIEGGLAEVYLRFGVESWSFEEPITPDSIERLLPYNGGGLEVAEAADRLYSEDIFRPLVARMARFSPSTPPDGSTPPGTDGGSTLPTPFAPSSPNGSAAGKRSAVQAR